MKNILSLDNNEAKAFFLKNESYCNIDLPEYFSFDKLLNKISNELNSNKISDFYTDVEPKYLDNVNHVIIGNKDGKFAWRSFELINPVLYVDLVNTITFDKNWEAIKSFLKNDEINNIECLSIPVLSTNKKKKDQAEQILNWWHKVEQKSLELALEYNFVILTDITNCYDLIYTHSIPWAMYGIENSKTKKLRNNYKLLGNIIDKSIRNMRYGQTNGIPTGSVIMDIVAEIVLAGIDKLLYERLSNEIKEEYKILRYRDDYRIFVNDPFIGDKMLKILSEELYKYNFRLNSNKTKKEEDIILSSVKSDKIALLELNKEYKTIQKELLVIYKFAKSFPNSGSLIIALDNLYDKIKDHDLKNENITVLISIIVQIMFENPRIIPLGTGILSLLLKNKSKKEVRSIIEKIIAKFNIIPNTGLLDIWLQRLSFKILPEYTYNETLTQQLLTQNSNKVWNFDWLINKNIEKLIKDTSVINKKMLDSMDNIISKNEFNVFKYTD